MASLLRPVAPTAPDMHVCSPEYGRRIRTGDCTQAIGGLPGGSVEVQFSTNRPNHPINLPITAEFG